MIHGSNSALDRVRAFSIAQADQALVELRNMPDNRMGLPQSIYRVCDGKRWQCEWDDLTEIGAFRSRSLGRAVRKAQRARRLALLAAVSEVADSPSDLVGGAS